MSESEKKHQAEEHAYELAKIKNEIDQISSVNMKDKKEWKDMIEIIKKLQEERTILLEREKED